MSTAGRPDADAPAASDIAGRLRETGFVRLVSAASADGLAASGVLARALTATDRPFQISVAPFGPDAERATDADLTVAVGRTDPTADVSLAAADRPASETAFDVARELGHDPAAALALAGAVADGRVTGDLLSAAEAAGIERRPGVAVPTADLADGLAHSTLFHAPFSGDRDAAAATLGELDLPDPLDDDDRRRVASLIALRAVGAETAPPRAGEAIERALRPFAGGPFETIGGYADVLDAVAREQPGTGVALALGHDVETAALDAWRSHAGRAHAALEGATTGRYDGLFVARADAADAPVETVARLLHAYRSPEPASLAVTDGRAAAVTDGTDVGPAVEEAARAADGTAESSGQTARARFDADTATFITAFREAQ